MPTLTNSAEVRAKLVEALKLDVGAGQAFQQSCHFGGRTSQ
jgi:hypothetical protein